MRAVDLTVDPSSLVATITLTDPDRRNVLSQRMLDHLHEALDHVCHTDQVRAVVIAAQGTDFSLGGDPAILTEARRLRGSEAEKFMRPHLDRLERVQRGLFTLPFPTVAAVTGQAAGAGMALALTADFRVLGPTAKLNLAYASIGLPPDGGTAWLLRRHLGDAGALKRLLTQRVVRTPEALTTGLGDTSADRGTELPTAQAIAADLAALPQASAEPAVRLLRLDNATDFATHMRAEHELMLEQLRRGTARG